MTTEGEEEEELVEILLVEPNPGDTRLFSETLKEAKLTNNVHAVPDGESALDFLYQRGENSDGPRPDLILLEPQLPGISGITVLSELNDDPALNEIPVVVLTSSGLGEDLVKSHDVGADHFIRKPIEADEFIDFAQSIEDFWLALVQPSSA